MAKTTSKSTKTRFICSLPLSMPARDAQLLAKKKGMEMSVAYIYNIRSAKSRTARKTMKPTVRIVTGGRKRQERALHELVVALGPSFCRKVLDDTEASMRGILCSEK